MTTPSPSISFRAAAARDITEITRLYSDAFKGLVETLGTSFYFASVLHSSRQRLIVAETEDHRVAGFALMNIDTATARNALNVDVIAVNDAYRRHGIGRQLMEQAEELGLKHRFNAMTLQVHEKNAPAIALYKKMGYVQTGFSERYYRDRAGAFQLKKTLVPQDATPAWARTDAQPRRKPGH